MNLPTLSAAQLTRAIAKHDVISSEICSEFIAAGRGRELPSETRKLSDPLALKWRANTETLSNLHAEREARMTWHGSIKPIRRIAA